MMSIFSINSPVRITGPSASPLWLTSNKNSCCDDYVENFQDDRVPAIFCYRYDIAKSRKI
jgi:hypothetical protein